MFPSAVLILMIGGGWTMADPRLSEALSGNSASLAAIRTLSAQVTFTVVPARSGAPIVYEADYWRDTNLVRARQIRVGADEAIEYLSRDGIQKSVFQSKLAQANRFAAGVLIAREGRPILVADPWKYALCGIPPFDSDDKPIPSATDACRQMTVLSVKEESIEKRRVLHVLLDENGTQYDVWFDQSVNWMIKKVVRTVPGRVGVPEARNEYEVDGFTEVQPTIFFPRRGVQRAYRGGQLTVSHEATFQKIVINGNRPLLRIPLPIVAGMMVTDEIRGTSYTCDQSGQPMGRQKVVVAAPNIGAASPESTRRSTTVAGGLPAAEPGLLSSPAFWSAIAAAVFFSTALVIKYRRR